MNNHSLFCGLISAYSDRSFSTVTLGRVPANICLELKFFEQKLYLQTLQICQDQRKQLNRSSSPSLHLCSPFFPHSPEATKFKVLKDFSIMK